VPLTNRRPDIVIYRADTIDVTPTRPEHVLLVAEIVSPGSETTDRIVKLDQYARAAIPFFDFRLHLHRYRRGNADVLNHSFRLPCEATGNTFRP
jgi:Uma2 family endonuclease